MNHREVKSVPPRSHKYYGIKLRFASLLHYSAFNHSTTLLEESGKTERRRELNFQFMNRNSVCLVDMDFNF